MSDAVQQGAMLNLMMQQAQQTTNSSDDEMVQKLQKLKSLFESGLIDETEYKSKKADLINQL